jgi:hypothetical protein
MSEKAAATAGSADPMPASSSAASVPSASSAPRKESLGYILLGYLLGGAAGSGAGAAIGLGILRLWLILYICWIGVEGPQIDEYLIPMFLAYKRWFALGGAVIGASLGIWLFRRQEPDSR